MSEYKSADIQRLFHVSSETVRRWSQEFEEYLSPNASPGRGRARQFTLEDLEVFALVSEVKENGGTYEDAHVSLKMGQRGSIDDIIEDRSLSVQANVELDLMQQRMNQLKVAYEDAITKTNQLESEVIRLETEVKQMEDVKTQLKDAQELINKLNREIGRLEAKLEIAQEKDEE